jgi:hypothetical protein
MSNRRPHTSKPAIPCRIRSIRQIEEERQSLAEQHKFRTLSLLGQAIKIKAVEFLPGVHNPGAETALNYITTGIEIACDNLRLDLQAGVIPGVTPTVGVAASSLDFFGAGTGIVGTLATFAHKLSTLLARSISFDAGGRNILIDDERCVRRIKTNSRLRREWERFMLHGAGIFFNTEPEEPRLTKHQEELKIQLMSAIEVFGLAREYGHHIAQYTRNEALENRRFTNLETDLLADEIAWTIGQYLGKRCFAGTFSSNRNTWMESGAGAVALLTGARVIRCTRDVVETGTHNDESRPGYIARLEALEDWNGFDDDPNKQRFRYQRWLVGRLIPSVFNEMNMRFWAAHKAGFRPTSVDSIREAVKDQDEGLAEILIKNIGPTSGGNSSEEEAWAKYVGTSADALRANSLALETALKAMRGGTSEPITIADQYMKHFQGKSVEEFSASIVKSKVGTVDPKIASSVAKRLSVGRIDDTRAGLQDCINLLSLMLEPTCRNLGLPLHEGVVCGIAWNPASGAAQLRLSEGASIILIPESVLMLCHFMSKLLAETLSVKAKGERLAIDCDVGRALRKIQANEKLSKYASGALAYCATWNLRNLTPLPPTAGDQRVLWLQLLMSTELFVVAHEYAHHICHHGVATSASVDGISSDVSKADELEADYYGALLAAHVGVEQKLKFAQYGSGAVIALVAVDMLRRTRDVLATGAETDFTSPTHPPLESRLLNLQRIRYDSRVAEAVKANQINFGNIMEGIWDLTLPLLRDMHAHGARPLPVGKEESQWLPFGGSIGQLLPAARHDWGLP